MPGLKSGKKHPQIPRVSNGICGFRSRPNSLVRLYQAEDTVACQLAGTGHGLVASRSSSCIRTGQGPMARFRGSKLGLFQVRMTLVPLWRDAQYWRRRPRTGNKPGRRSGLPVDRSAGHSTPLVTLMEYNSTPPPPSWAFEVDELASEYRPAVWTINENSVPEGPRPKFATPSVMLVVSVAFMAVNWKPSSLNTSKL